MDELTPSARLLLDEARRAYSPSSAELDRLRTRLRSQPVPPEPSDARPPSDGGSPSVEVSLGSTAANWGLYLVIAVVVGALWWAFGGLSTRNDVAPIPRVIPTLPHVPVEPAPVRDFSSPSLAATIVPATADPSPPKGRVPKVAPPRATDPATTPVLADDDFARELSIIGEARRALGRRAWTEVHVLTGLYAREFPNGSFGEEAEVLDLLARCSEGSDPGTIDEAKAYVDAPGRVFAERVRKACLPSQPGDPSMPP